MISIQEWQRRADESQRRVDQQRLDVPHEGWWLFGLGILAAIAITAFVLIAIGLFR